VLVVQLGDRGARLPAAGDRSLVVAAADQDQCMNVVKRELQHRLARGAHGGLGALEQPRGVVEPITQVRGADHREQRGAHGG
jgi:hypothetical protein